MNRYSKEQIITEINNGNDDILLFLAKKYFPECRRMLRLRGFRDKDTPVIFSEVLLDTFVSLTGAQSDNSSLQRADDFEEHLLIRLKDFINEQKNKPLQEPETDKNKEQEVIAKCVDVLDSDYRDLLFARVVKNQSYEKIAEQGKYNSAVVAQYEYNKACNQLEAVIDARLNSENR